MNLTEAQLTSQVRFQLEYKAIEDLKLMDMSPNQWHQYVLRMADDENLFKSYRSHFARFGPMVSGSCDNECRINMLCKLVTANSKGLVIRNEECLEIEKNLYITHFWWEILFGR